MKKKFRAEQLASRPRTREWIVGWAASCVVREWRKGEERERLAELGSASS
jgi:hypothetical protein